MNNSRNRQSLIAFIIIMATSIMLSCQSPTGTTMLSATEFDQSMRNLSKDKYVLLDVRTPEEFSEGHLEGALNIDYNNSAFTSNIEKLDKQKTMYVYCRSGRRSAEAASIMRAKGFTKVLELQGGIMAWEDSHLNVVK